jgi:hypothetical protein
VDKGGTAQLVKIYDKQKTEYTRIMDSYYNDEKLHM